MKCQISNIKYLIANKSGQSLIELMITIGIAAIIIPALLTGFVAARSGRAQGEQRQQAVAFVREGQEASRVFRETDWTTFANLSNSAATYFPFQQGSTWILKPGTDTPSTGLTRKVVITDVYRDPGTYAIESSSTPGSIDDPSTKEVTTTVTWSNPIPNSSVSSSEYLTRYLGSTSFTDTSVNDFTKTGSVLTSVVANSPSSSTTSPDGQITLAQAPTIADWCSPGTPVATTNLGGNGLAGSVVAGINRAFVGTGQNASSRPFYNVTIDNSGAIPSASVASNGYYDTSGLKSNDVFGETRGDGTSYAYLATAHNGGRWVVILNVTSNPPVLVTNISSQNNNDATSIFVSNKILYFTAGNVLYRYDVSTPASPVAKGSFTLNGNNTIGNKLYVVNNYVYVALGSTTNQLQIVDANDPTTMKNPGGVSSAVVLPLNNQQAVGVYVLADGSRAYIATSLGSTNQKDFFIINTSTKSSPSLVSVGGVNGLSTGTMNPKGITVIQNRAIVVGFTNPRYQVFKVKDDTSGADMYNSCAAINEPDDIYNVSSETVGTHAYSYVTTANTSSAFEIIEGGLGGGGGYSSPGTYQSGPFGNPNTITPKLTAFYRADITYNKPTGTNIQFQIGIADASVGGTCSGVSYTFAGPSGPGSWFTSSPSSPTDQISSYLIPFPQPTGWSSYINPGKCFVYVAQLTGTLTATPILKDVTITYAP